MTENASPNTLCPHCGNPVPHYTSHMIKGQDSVEGWICKRALDSAAPPVQPLTEEIELLQCPFCGGRPMVDTSSLDPEMWAFCADCGVGYHGATIETAIKLWNTRADSSLRRELERQESRWEAAIALHDKQAREIEQLRRELEEAREERDNALTLADTLTTKIGEMAKDTDSAAHWVWVRRIRIVTRRA